VIVRAPFLLLLLGAPTALQSQIAPALPRGTIRGAVVEAATMQPLEGATVIVAPAAQGAVLPPLQGVPGLFAIARSAVTGPDGRYQFVDLPVGDYQLRVQRIGYRPVTLGVQLADRADARVSIGLTVAPIRLHAFAVSADATPSYGRMEAETDRAGVLRVASARLRQQQFMSSDVRELTHADVVEAVTLGEADLFRAFQRLPGVTTRDDYTAELWTRGARADLTRVQFDGLPLFGPLHTFGLLSGVGTDVVGAAFLHPGVRPASIGEGVAGVIDVRSRPGGGAGTVRGLAELSLLSARVALDQRRRDGRSAWMVAARRSYLDWILGTVGWLSSADVGYPYHFGDVAGRFDYQLDAGHALEVSGLLTRDVINADAFEVLRGDRVVWGNGTARASLLGSVGGIRARHTIGVSRFAAHTDTIPGVSLATLLASPTSAPHYSPAEVPVRATVLHVSASSEFEASPREAVGAPWSFGYALTNQRVRMSENVEQFLITGGTPDTRIPATQPTWFGSLWGEVRWRLAPRLVLETGLRVDAGRPVANAAAIRPMPRAQARFAPDSHTVLTAGVGRSVQYTQALGRSEWGRDALLVASPLWVVAGTDVPAVIADLATLGAERWLGAAWLAGVNAYRRRSTGYVVRDPVPGLLFARPLVIGTERASGIELSARRLAGVVTGAASYSFAVASTEAHGLEFPSSQDRRHSVDVTALARLAPGVHAGAAYTFATGAPYTRVRSEFEQNSAGEWRMTPARTEEPNAHRMRSHVNLDLLLEWALGRAQRWTLFFQLRNALDRENPMIFLLYDACPTPAPAFYACGDRFNAGVRRIPVIGLRARF
jgi:carboxypeptidase family protein/TonB-dependent receptor-like protein